MQRFLIRRVGLAFLSFFALSILAFLLVRDGYIEVLMPIVHPADLHAYKLPNPVAHYAEYMKDIIRGDWGHTWKWGPDIGKVALERFHMTLRLASLAMGVIAVLGVSLGVLAAINKGSVFDRWTTVAILLGKSMPVFWLGLILYWVFAVISGSLPSTDDGNLVPTILPAVTLALLPTTVLVNFTRSAMQSSFESGYVKLARIKGLHEWKIIWKHCLRNAAISPHSSFGVIAGAFLISLVLTEAVFAWPGVGLMAIEAILLRDTYALGGLVLFSGGAFILCHLVLDVLRAFLDPRIRYSERTYIQYQV